MADHQKRNMNQRRGYTLIELLVLITVGSVMMGVAVALLYAVFRCEAAGRDHVRRMTVLSRLARQFRRDVHAATGLALREAPPEPEGVGPGSPTWQFDLAPNTTATYTAERGQLVRVERLGGAVSRRESYALPPGAAVSIDVREDATPKIVRLRIVPRPAEPDATGTPVGPAGPTVCIDAALAKDHRFENPQETSPEGPDE